MATSPLEARLGGMEVRVARLAGVYEQVNERLGAIEQRMAPPTGGRPEGAGSSHPSTA